MTARQHTHRFLHWILPAALIGLTVVRAEGSVEYPGPPPGKARASTRNHEIVLGNDAFECAWSIAGGRLKPTYVKTRQDHSLPQRRECFRLLLSDGRSVLASDLKIVRGPDFDTLPPDHQALRLAAKNTGCQVRLTLVTPDDNLTALWRVELRDGSNYIRQYVTLTPKNSDLELREIALVLEAEGEPAGELDGSPITVADELFLAFEHPLSKTRKSATELECILPQSVLLKAGEEQTYSSVLGAAPPGQLRRAFLHYVERERAQPYRPFLHYNSWYDIGYGADQILEPDALKVIDLFGRELIERRKVPVDSFVWDDGWDNPASLWQFHDGFPKGFTLLQEKAEQYNSAIGAWLSPWGGYGKPKEERMKYGQQEGFETNSRGFSMAGPKYYGRFRDACLGMVRDYALNYFKFDGISSGGVPTGAPPESAADVEALLRLIGDLRRTKPDLFINVTTGTWSSPYWLWYADSTWRSGRDWGTCGWGSQRQQQVTYRDAQTYQNVVCRAPLYPINSLMTQGVMFANHGLPDDTDRIIEDIRAFFASGTNCQELYITPSLLDKETWDALAEAAKWSRENADVLVDTHWIGGDPAKGQVYGWASWSKRKGILALRNPKDEPGRIVLDVGKAFELPEGAAQRYHLRIPWRADATTPEITLSVGEEHTFELEPFQVLVWDADPLRAERNAR